jgi:hypothetical protein
MKQQIIKVFVALLLISCGIGITYVGFAAMPEGDTDYEYTVKAEQVNEDEMVDEAIEYENLTEAEQRVLYDAFKKSDHFLGGSEAVVVTDEPINVSNEWRVIEIQGVPMLVAFSGPEEFPDTEHPLQKFGAFIIIAIGMIWTLVFIMVASDEL